MSSRTVVSPAAFDAFVQQAERRYELIAGELVEGPAPPYSSQIAALVVYLCANALGHVTGEGGKKCRFRVVFPLYQPQSGVWERGIKGVRGKNWHSLSSYLGGR